MQIERTDYLDRIVPFVGKDLIIALVGMRRSGKSVLLGQLRQRLIDDGVSADQCFTYDFEQMLDASDLTDGQALVDRVLADVHSKGNLEERHKVYLFFDEVQEVSGWESAITRLRRNLDCQIFLTGSNASLLGGELAAKLAGRYVSFTVYPFSFVEFLEAYRGHLTEAAYLGAGDANNIGTAPLAPVSATEIFQKYLVFGGLPQLPALGFDMDVSTTYVQDIYRSVLFRDVATRFKVRDTDLLERLLRYLIRIDGQPTTVNALRKYLRATSHTASSDTIANYLQYFEQAFVVTRVRDVLLGAKEELKDASKYYLMDHGLRGILIGNNLTDVNTTLENIVCNELLRRGYEVMVGKVGSVVVDFVAQRRDERLYIQVAYLLASPEIVSREFAPFEKLRDSHPRLVLSLDQLDMSQNGVRHRNIIDWLQDS